MKCSPGRDFGTKAGVSGDPPILGLQESDRSSQENSPFIVPIQDEKLSEFDTVVCIPLSRSHRDLDYRFLFPTLLVAGERLTLVPLLIAALPRRLLDKPVESLEEQGHRISTAIDSSMRAI